MSLKQALFTVALVGGLLLGALGPARAQSAPLSQLDPPTPSMETPVGEAIAPGAIDDARAYWTPRRMAEATPMSAPSLSGATTADPAPVLMSGTPGTIEPFAPAGVTSGTGSPTGVHKARADNGVVYERYEIQNPDVYPYATEGKLFFTNGNTGRSESCSGSVVHSTSLSVVLTAGHCVRNAGPSGRWHRHWLFAPAYHDGKAPHGAWAAKALVSVQGWTERGNLNYDVGAAILQPLDGARIEEVVGGQGIQWNQSRSRNVTALGYPTEPFTGEELIACESPSKGTDPWNSSLGPEPLLIGCDMTRGASGGGWVVAGKYLNSVTSYYYREVDDVLYGPYFGDAVRRLYNEVRDGEGPQTVQHQRSVGLRLRGGLVATGKVAANGYGRCVAHVSVRILKRSGGSWKRLETARTDDLGRYRVRLPNERGTYRTLAPYTRLSEYQRCSAATSARRRH